MDATALGDLEVLPTEIRCIILSSLSVQDLFPFFLVSTSCNVLASSDAVWKVYCDRHFPHHAETIEPLYKEPVPSEQDSESLQYVVTHLPASPSSATSWKDRYKYFTRNLFVLHHKYNAINIGALNDAIAKWEQSGVNCIDVRAACNLFTDNNLDSHIADIKLLLKRHRVIFLFTDGGMKDPYRSTLGDTLCDFVEDGNAVILGTFCTVATAEMPGGKWQAKNYNPILPASQDSDIHFLGDKILPFHPIVKDVNNISASWKATGEPHPDANLIAVYETGYVLAAELEISSSSSSEKKNRKGLVIALNIYLPSSDSPLNGWSNEPGNDVRKLFFNSFRYAMNYVCNQND